MERNYYITVDPAAEADFMRVARGGSALSLFVQRITDGSLDEDLDARFSTGHVHCSIALECGASVSVTLVGETDSGTELVISAVEPA